MTRDLDQFSIQTSAVLAVEEPQYATLATQPLATYIDKEVRSRYIHAFPRSIAIGYQLGLLIDPMQGCVQQSSRELKLSHNDHVWRG